MHEKCENSKCLLPSLFPFPNESFLIKNILIDLFSHINHNTDIQNTMQSHMNDLFVQGNPLVNAKFLLLSEGRNHILLLLVHLFPSISFPAFAAFSLFFSLSLSLSLSLSAFLQAMFHIYAIFREKTFLSAFCWVVCISSPHYHLTSKRQ
jgi:hypothetical protein